MKRIRHYESYLRIPDQIGGRTVFTAHREFMDICQYCGYHVQRDKWYVLVGGKAAHYGCARIQSAKEPASGPKKRYVLWFNLLNKSTHQTLDDLRAFLIAKGLSDGLQATAKAYRLKFAKLVGEKEKWDVNRYINMMQSDKKAQRLLRQNKFVSPKLRRRALLYEDR